MVQGGDCFVFPRLPGLGKTGGHGGPPLREMWDCRRYTYSILVGVPPLRGMWFMLGMVERVMVVYLENLFSGQRVRVHAGEGGCAPASPAAIVA